MNKVNKLETIAIVFAAIIMICGSVMATDLKTSLDIIQQASEIKYLENDQGYISKTIVDSNSDTGEVTVELKLSNIKKDTEQVKTEGTEIILVIDNSISMNEIVTGEKTRRDVILNSAIEFVNQVYSNIEGLKVGIVKYYGYDVDENEEPIQTTGTIETANIIQNLTDDKTKILNSIESLKDIEYEYSTNTDAGLLRAKNMFSNANSNKFIILLSDGVPNNAVGFSWSNYTYGLLGKYLTEAEAINARNKDVIKMTKNTINSIDNSGINLITILVGLGELDEDDSNVVESVFGTNKKPTAGKLYNIADNDIKDIVENNLYSDVIEKIQNPINTVKIVDYFPDDITQNFTFSYVGKTSAGNASEEIEEDTNTITWDIETVKGNEVATLKYKLKLKDMKNTKILNRTISTNEKVVLTYKDNEDKDYTVTLSSSPQIQLTEVKEEKEQQENNTLEENNIKIDNNDKTTSTGRLPQTGVSIAIIIVIAIMAICGFIWYLQYNKYKDIK